MMLFSWMRSSQSKRVSVSVSISNYEFLFIQAFDFELASDFGAKAFPLSEDPIVLQIRMP